MEERISECTGDATASGGTERKRGPLPIDSAAVSPSPRAPVRAAQAAAGTTLVLGMGNSLRRDDGAGVHAIRYLQEHYPPLPDVELMDGGTLGFTLAAPISDTQRLIVIDATNLAAAPGTVRLFEGAEMDALLLDGKKRTTAHEAGLVEVMLMAQLTDTVPRQRALIAIQPETLELGEDPSAAVRRAIPAVCDMVLELISRWQS